MKGILKDAAILFVITLVAGLCLGAVHEVTLDPIAKAQEAAATKTYKEVFPEAAKFEQTDELTAAVAASADEILAQGFGNVSVDDAQVAETEDGSVLGYLITASSTEGYNGLGVSRSLGCVRLTCENSKWVYDNCPIGTSVVIYEDPNVASPFDKPDLIPVSDNQYWDPTDPLIQR